MNFEIGHISCALIEGTFEHVLNPGSANEIVGAGLNRVVMTSTDNWTGHFGVVEYPDGTKTGRFFWHKEPLVDPYSRLREAGTTSVYEVGGRWVSMIRMLKINGQGRPNLFDTSFDEMDALLDNASAENLINSKKNVTFGSFRSFVETSNKTGLAMSVEIGDIVSLSAMVAITRPIALLKRVRA